MERQKLGEIKLFESTSERKRIEDLSDLYAIIRITESIEAAYGRDAVTAAEYTDECTKLISQFKSVESALISSKAIASAEVFIKEFQIECPRAYERLVVAGDPNLSVTVLS